MNNFRLPKYPGIFEINTRAWLESMQSKYPDIKLNDVHPDIWSEIKNQGFDLVWLMGVWQNNVHLVDKYAYDEGLLDAYGKALPDWTKQDVVGSPYAIDQYKLNPLIGKKGALRSVKTEMNNLGLGLILDFVPNHFHAESQIIEQVPNAFLKGSKDLLEKDPVTYYESVHNAELILAHGKDPYFAAWQDTVQVNIFHEAGRKLLINTLLELTKVCDGVRCDMAMLLMNDVFSETWKQPLAIHEATSPGNEFWFEAISAVKAVRPDFIFIAEAYWDLEWDLQQLGFDFTYDKRLRDRLLFNPVHEVRDHLRATGEFQDKSVRFLENHDEDRAFSAFGEQKSMAAAMVTYTVPGMRFVHDGQFEGVKNKVPVQLGRFPRTFANQRLIRFYTKLFKLINSEIFRNGDWGLIEVYPKDDDSFSNILAWEWRNGNDHAIVIINYSPFPASCFVSKGKLNRSFVLEAYHSVIYNNEVNIEF
ncbi:MAG: alpha-amylase family glycosyl hydrolase [Bacteroidota bacterium]